MAQQRINWLFGRSLADKIPARLARAVERQELQSEKLIGFAQLTIGILWSTLYAVSPKTFSSEDTFAPVPFALAVYICFTLVRLFLSYAEVVPAWFLALSVILDMCILMGVIWSFHLQYEQPAAFYLKAPTVLYVFIFIALRALRFSVMYLVLSGLVAAAAWGFMVYYAYMHAPPGMGITRDYVKYMTSSHILLGAEMDKIITILLTTLILALAIVRARRLLVEAVVQGAASDELSRFFAPEIAQTITQSENRIEPGKGQIRQAAILFCDIRGFTPLAMSMDPDALMDLLADYQARMLHIIHKHGGTVDKFMGDAVMATFGAAVETEQYAADALRTVQDIQQQTDAWNAQREAASLPLLRIGCSVAAGSVVFGAVGDHDRLEFTVIGDPVNLAAKLEKANKTEAVRALTDAATFALALQQGFQPAGVEEERPQRSVAGLDVPRDLVVLRAGERIGPANYL